MSGDYPDIPFVPAGGHGGNRSQTQMVVIHATDNTASDTAEASYATHRADQISAHFYSDEDSVTQGVLLAQVAYGCWPIGNSRSVQFELVGLSNKLTDATLRRVAPIVRRVCDRYGIPIRHVSPADLRAGTKGICGHGDVTAAWGEGDHTDPGASFPWATFIEYVNGGDGNMALTPAQEAQLMSAVGYINLYLPEMAWREDAIYADRPVTVGGQYVGKPEGVNRLHAALEALKAKPAITIDAAALATALQDPTFLAGLAKAVNDDAAKRLAS